MYFGSVCPTLSWRVLFQLGGRCRPVEKGRHRQRHVGSKLCSWRCSRVYSTLSLTDNSQHVQINDFLTTDILEKHGLWLSTWQWTDRIQSFETVILINVKTVVFKNCLQISGCKMRCDMHLCDNAEEAVMSSIHLERSHYLSRAGWSCLLSHWSQLAPSTFKCHSDHQRASWY